MLYQSFDHKELKQRSVELKSLTLHDCNDIAMLETNHSPAVPSLADFYNDRNGEPTINEIVAFLRGVFGSLSHPQVSVAATSTQLVANISSTMERLQLTPEEVGFDPAMERRGSHSRGGIRVAIPLTVLLETLWDFIADVVHRMIERNLSANVALRVADRRKLLHSGMTRPSDEFKRRRVSDTSRDNLCAKDIAILSLLVSSSIPQQREARHSSIDDCAKRLSTHCALAFGCPISEELVRDHIAPLVHIDGLEPTVFLADTIARTGLMDEFMGTVLVQTLRRHLWHHAFPDAAASQTTLDQDLLIREHVAMAEKICRAKLAAARGRVREIQDLVGTSKMLNPDAHCVAATSTARETNVRMSSFKAFHTMKFALETRMAFSRAPTSLQEAEAAITKMRYGEYAEVEESLGEICGKVTLGRHVIWTDEALDHCIKKKVEEVSPEQSS
jgi:hypothetical protein